MISERTLKKWRREALLISKAQQGDTWKLLTDRIIKMTQELLDQHLLKKE